MADIKLIDAQGDERTYNGVAKVKIPLADGTGNATFIQPAGKKELTDTNEVDVTNFATAQVVDENLVAENIKSGVTVLGIVGTHEGGSGGTCTGNHIIEVDELPTENIDKTALYKCGDSYYQYKEEFKDIYIAIYGTTASLVDAYISQGFTVELYYVGTKPTTDIKEYSETTMLAPVYYVEDEGDCFVYTSGMWISISTQLSGVENGGAISDVSEATTQNTYYALIECGWKPLGAAEYTGEVVIE